MYENRSIQNAYQKLIKTVIEIDRCTNCFYYQPKFRYRTCLYATCPHGKGNAAVFRKKPLKKEYFPKREEN